jgi:dihydroxyacid dehydratase/phosphogluconate dehydratase
MLLNLDYGTRRIYLRCPSFDRDGKSCRRRCLLRRFSAKAPADLKPSEKYAMEDIQRYGGIPAVLRYPYGKGMIHGDCMTATSKTILFSPDEMASRAKSWKAPPLKATRGTLYKYIKTVSSASKGCVTDE